MTETALTKAKDRPTKAVMKRKMMIIGLMATGVTTGCVTIKAPDKPIVINLNISVTQEVVYRLDGQAKNLIQANPGIF